jgi:hypothetical protein
LGTLLSKHALLVLKYYTSLTHFLLLEVVSKMLGVRWGGQEGVLATLFDLI